MANWERELSQALDKEKGLLEKLEEFSREKTDLLARGEVDALNLLTGKEEPVVIQLQAMEEQRLQIMRKYGLHTATLSETAQKANETYRQIFLLQLKSISETAAKLKKRNRLNGDLTRSRIEFYGKLRALMAKPLYGNDGKTSQAAGRSYIDRKI